MRFLDREQELERLDSLAQDGEGGLAAIYGRRRLGKTRLLVEWSQRHGGVYCVADQSAAAVQRRWVSSAVAARLPGFDEIEYPDWRTLLSRFAREAQTAGYRGPFILDEFPYFVLSAPELPSILQNWIDHEARQARLSVAIAGSSQRMMQGWVLAPDAPLYGRAREVLPIQPLAVDLLSSVFELRSMQSLVETWVAWGGVPRYWELAAPGAESITAAIDRLVLDPLAPLHREPDRILLEEVPAAAEVRPVLDVIGTGAHRVSEIAGRLGRPATSLARPLDRLLGLGLARREVPFGESEKVARRSLYRIDDPFFRMWFRVVAPNRGLLAVATRAERLAVLERHWTGLSAETFEELVRARLPHLSRSSALGKHGPFATGSRWWRGSDPEWDVVSESEDGVLLLGEVKWSARSLGRESIAAAVGRLATRAPPALPRRFAQHRPIRVLFVASLQSGVPRRFGDVLVVTADQFLGHISRRRS
ncbi:MAG TPA: ATP-binding protein [Planctomycetota bacterium]|nr:ATP-binding protein [Planctomycetota bacterium]